MNFRVKFLPCIYFYIWSLKINLPIALSLKNIQNVPSVEYNNWYYNKYSKIYCNFLLEVITIYLIFLSVTLTKNNRLPFPFQTPYRYFTKPGSDSSWKTAPTQNQKVIFHIGNQSGRDNGDSTNANWLSPDRRTFHYTRRLQVWKQQLSPPVRPAPLAATPHAPGIRYLINELYYYSDKI